MNRSNALIVLGAAVIVAGALLWRGLPFPGHAQAQAVREEVKEDKRTLSTAGTGVIRIKPDSARVFFRVETIAPDIKSARDENAKKVKRVQNGLGALKIDGLKMKSDNVSVTLVYDSHTPHLLPKILGYKVTHSFTALITNEDPVKLSEGASKMVDASLEAGANAIEQVVFFRRQTNELRREALTKAVEDAMANARALAAGAKKMIIEPITIAGEPRYHFPATNQRFQNAINFDMPGGGDEGPTPLVAGELEITCTVNVTCRY
jgi:uncharacterized protein YggE